MNVNVVNMVSSDIPHELFFGIKSALHLYLYPNNGYAKFNNYQLCNYRLIN